MAETAEVAEIRPLRVLPGGAQAVPEEYVAAGIMAGALVLLWAMRRGLGHDATHVHAGGAAAFTFVAYYLIVTGMIRLLAARLAERGDSPLARAVGFYA
jgi:hypothetical protein